MRRARGSPRAPTRESSRQSREPEGGDSVQIDRLDIAILRVLQHDGRASFREVARRVGASVTTVSTRIDRLWRSGILTGFVPLLSARRLQEVGRPPHCVVCFIRPNGGGVRGLARVADAVAEHPRVCYVFEVMPGPQLIALASTRSEAESEALVSELSRLEGVSAVRTSPIRRVHKERPNHPIPAAPLPA